MEDKKKDKKSVGCTIGIIAIVLFFWSLKGIGIDADGLFYRPFSGVFGSISAIFKILGIVIVIGIVSLIINGFINKG